MVIGRRLNSTLIIKTNMTQTTGTNFFTKYTSTVDVALTNASGNATLIRCVAGSLPTDAGYAVGCIAQATDSGVLYYNTGTTSIGSFTAVNAGAAALTVPTSLTDSTTTTGNALRILTTAGTFTTGGAAIKADLAAGTAGNGLVAITTGAYTGTGLLLLTANTLATGTLATLSATSQTSGVGLSITGGGANLLTAGIVADIEMGAATVGAGLKVLTSGTYTDASSAVVNITASSATTGNVLGIITPSTKAIAVGRLIATPAFQVDCSTATQVAGLKITGAATAGTVAIAAIDSGAAAGISLDAKGTGNVSISGVSTGILALGRTAAGTILGGVVNATIATQSFTVTAAQLLGGLITHTSTTGAGTFTLCTGTQMSSGISGVATGDSQWTCYANVGNQTVTITAAVGFTITGTAAVPSGKNAQIYSVCTGANTWIANITLSA